MLFGCVGSKPQSNSNPIPLSDSDIAPSNPPTDPTLTSDTLVVDDSEFSVVENDTSVFPEDDLVLASDDILIESE